MIEYRVIVPEAKIEILGQTDCQEDSASLTRKSRENEGISRGSKPVEDCYFRGFSCASLKYLLVLVVT